MERVAQTVRLLDEAGRPCVDAILAAVSAQGPVPELGYRTGTDGRARIGLPPGEALLEATLVDGRRRRYRIEVTTEPEYEHELRMV